VSIARGESDAHKGESDRLGEELEKAQAALAGAEGELQRLRELPEKLEEAQAAAAAVAAVQAQLESERALGMSMAARAEQAESRVKELEPQLATAEQAAAQREAARAALEAKARELFGQEQSAQAQLARLRAERDEARGVARTLHARAEAEARGQQDLTATLAAERQLASQLLTEKQRLELQIDSLSRQLDTERAARARLASELALGSGKRAAADTSRQETKPYELAGLSPTVREMPALKLEPRTDPVNPVPVPPGKGKK
jgi:chromosome segregation ATPase